MWQQVFQSLHINEVFWCNFCLKFNTEIITWYQQFVWYSNAGFISLQVCTPETIVLLNESWCPKNNITNHVKNTIFITLSLSLYCFCFVYLHPYSFCCFFSIILFIYLFIFVFFCCCCNFCLHIRICWRIFLAFLQIKHFCLLYVDPLGHLSMPV